MLAISPILISIQIFKKLGFWSLLRTSFSYNDLICCFFGFYICNCSEGSMKNNNFFFSLLAPCVLLQSHLGLVSGSRTCFRVAVGWPVSSDQCLVSIFNFRNHRLGGGFAHTDFQSVNCWSKNKWQCCLLTNPNMLVSGLIAEVQDMFESHIWVAGRNGACCMTN